MSRFYSFVGDMGWWLGALMDFMLLSSAVANTGFIDKFCCGPPLHA